MDVVQAFDQAVARYHQLFGNTPSIYTLNSRYYEPATRLLLQAVQTQRPLSDGDFYRRLGLEPPPEQDTL